MMGIIKIHIRVIIMYYILICNSDIAYPMMNHKLSLETLLYDYLFNP